MTREDVVTLIEKHGGRVCTKVSMVTTYLVTGTKLIGFDKRLLSHDVTTSQKYKEMLRVNSRKTSENLSETLLCTVLNESQLQQMASTEAGATSTSQSGFDLGTEASSSEGKKKENQASSTKTKNPPLKCNEEIDRLLGMWSATLSTAAFSKWSRSKTQERVKMIGEQEEILFATMVHLEDTYNIDWSTFSIDAVNSSTWDGVVAVYNICRRDTTPQSASSLESATSLLPAYSQPPASLQPASSHLVIWLKCSLFFTCC